MDNQAVLQMRDCWICLNNGNNRTLTKLDCKQMLTNFKTYLDNSIIIKSFENETHVPCCFVCYESARHLTTLEEQVKRLQKEILDFSIIFSKNVLQRISAKELTAKIANCRTTQKKPDRDSIEVLENTIVKKEVDNFLSNELPSVSQRKPENDDLGSLSLFRLDGPENIIIDAWGNVVHSNYDEIEVKCSVNETFSKADDDVNKEFAPDEQISATSADGDQGGKSMSMSDSSKCGKRPIIGLEEFLPDGSRNSTKIVGDAVEGKAKCEKLLDESSKSNNCSETHSKELPEEEVMKMIDLIENNPYKCLLCGDRFNSKINLQVHSIEMHNKDRPYNCPFCEKSYLGRSELKTHLKRHTGERRYKCSICSKSFFDERNLNDHEKTHSEERPHKCSLCEKSFKHSISLKKHERIHAGHSAKRPNNCSFCEKSFRTPSALKKHEKVHTREKPFNCSFCEKSFLKSSALKMHERIHTGEKPFSCSICSKSFNSSGDLKRHEQYHSVEKPYKCSSCPKSFRSRSNLKTHQEIHSEERPYQCSLCEKSFKRPAKLRVHERTHSGERPYKCSFCPNTFRYSEDAKRHQEVHTGQTGYKCPICEKTFTFSQYYKNHLKRQHGETHEEFILP